MEMTKMMVEGRVVDIVNTHFSKAFDKVYHGRLIPGNVQGINNLCLDLMDA